MSLQSTFRSRCCCYLLMHPFTPHWLSLQRALYNTQPELTLCSCILLKYFTHNHLIQKYCKCLKLAADSFLLCTVSGQVHHRAGPSHATSLPEPLPTVTMDSQSETSRTLTIFILGDKAHRPGYLTLFYHCRPFFNSE